jgi:uncharacterized MnhB-related membrane protein
MLMIFLLFTAYFALFTEDLLISVINLFLFSTILIVVFVILQAPDAALAEAVIGAGLTIAFFVITINETGAWGNE